MAKSDKKSKVDKNITSGRGRAYVRSTFNNTLVTITDTSGNTLQYNTKESLLNPEFFACGATPHNWKQYLE